MTVSRKRLIVIDNCHLLVAVFSSWPLYVECFIYSTLILLQTTKNNPQATSNTEAEVRFNNIIVAVLPITIFTYFILSILGKTFSRRHTRNKIFCSCFSQKTGFHANYVDTICMKCQILFTGKNKTRCHQLDVLASIELSQRVVKVKC